MHPVLGLDGLKANIALLDRSGTIVGVNAGWRAFGRATGVTLPDDGVGRNYLEFCPADVPGDALRRDLQAAMGSRLDLVTLA